MKQSIFERIAAVSGAYFDINGHGWYRHGQPIEAVQGHRKRSGAEVMAAIDRLRALELRCRDVREDLEEMIEDFEAALDAE